MTDWSPLYREFDTWTARDRTIPVWWRDDDAVAPTPELDRLLELSERLTVPLHLAVIPAHVRNELARRLEGTQARVLTHGWAHENHAPPSEKKAEFRDHRPHDAMLSELERGFATISTLFGEAFTPVFVPPWNRVSEGVIAALPEIGYSHVSTFNARTRPFEINTHIDPIDWRGTRSCVPPDDVVAHCADLLRQRREGKMDASEPLGFLTHHLVHDAAIWEFTEKFWREMLTGPVHVVESL